MSCQEVILDFGGGTKPRQLDAAAFSGACPWVSL